MPRVLILVQVQDYKVHLLRTKSVVVLVEQLLQESTVIKELVEDLLAFVDLLPFGIKGVRMDLEGELILDLDICMSSEKMRFIGVVVDLFMVITH